MNLQIIPIPILHDNYVWTIINSANNCALVVDPGEAEPIIHYLQDHQLQLGAILITHHHWDHTNGLQRLTKLYDVQVFASNHALGNHIVPCHDNDEIYILPVFPSYHVLAIPGHTLDHIAFYDQQHLFCGDTLFAGGCGRLFEGTAVQLYQSLQRLAQLPLETKIYCAHEYTLNNLRFAKTVEPHNQKIDERVDKVNRLLSDKKPSLPSLLQEEKATNPFLRCDVPAVIAFVEAHLGRKIQDSIDVFKTLRMMKDNFT